jgi:hypothetical protein
MLRYGHGIERRKDTAMAQTSDLPEVVAFLADMQDLINRGLIRELPGGRYELTEAGEAAARHHDDAFQAGQAAAFGQIAAIAAALAS